MYAIRQRVEVHQSYFFNRTSMYSVNPTPKNKREIGAHLELPTSHSDTSDVRKLRRLALLGLDGLGSRARADLDLLRLGFRLLCQLQLENAIFIGGIHVLRIDRVRQRERARKSTVAALNAMEVFFLLFFLEVTLAAHRQSVVLQFDVQIFLLNSGDLQLEGDVVLIFIDINRGHEGAAGEQFITSAAVVLEDSIDLILEIHQITKGFKASEICHFSIPPKVSVFKV